MSEENKADDNSVGVKDPPTPSDSPGTEQLDKIRSILFGEQVRAQESQITRLQSELQQAISTINALMDRRFGEAANQLSRERDTLASKLAEESSERGKLIAGLETTMSQLGSKAGQDRQKLNQTLSSKIESAQSLLTEKIESETKVLSERMASTSGDIGKRLDDAVRELNDRKSDRASTLR